VEENEEASRDLKCKPDPVVEESDTELGVCGRGGLCSRFARELCSLRLARGLAGDGLMLRSFHA
jgi:hypothetical protein